jgi:hypothetical protein
MMSETEFNAELRKVLRAHGIRAIHIREADQPGVLDLLCYDGDRILGWLELKIKNTAVRTSQREFIKDRHKDVEDCCIIRLHSDDGQIEVAKPHFLDKGKFFEQKVGEMRNFRTVRWKAALIAWSRIRFGTAAL